MLPSDLLYLFKDLLPAGFLLLLPLVVAVQGLPAEAYGFMEVAEGIAVLLPVVVEPVEGGVKKFFFKSTPSSWPASSIIFS